MACSVATGRICWTGLPRLHLLPGQIVLSPRSAEVRQQLIRVAMAVLYPQPADPSEANLAAYPDDVLPGAPAFNLCQAARGIVRDQLRKCLSTLDWGFQLGHFGQAQGNPVSASGLLKTKLAAYHSVPSHPDQTPRNSWGSFSCRRRCIPSAKAVGPQSSWSPAAGHGSAGGFRRPRRGGAAVPRRALRRGACQPVLRAVRPCAPAAAAGATSSYLDRLSG